ncbi:MAG TPA: DUF6011 domain-containing protein, partial [Nitrososphaera sp.]
YEIKKPNEDATDAQKSFIRSLVEQKDISALSEAQQEYLKADDFDGLKKGQASDAIKILLAQPKKSKKPAIVPPQVVAETIASQPTQDGHNSKASHYFITDPTDGKEKFVTIWMSVRASDDMYPVTNPEHRNQIIQEVAKDPVGAMNEYGVKLGICGRCGRTLTDRDSRLRGIGPVCAQKLAMIPTPEQREMLDEWLATQDDKEGTDA